MVLCCCSCHHLLLVVVCVFDAVSLALLRGALGVGGLLVLFCLAIMVELLVVVMVFSLRVA